MDNESLISNACPNLTPEISDKLLQKLRELGVTKPEDWNYVMEKDLVPLLKPIQARKLVEQAKLQGTTFY